MQKQLLVLVGRVLAISPIVKFHLPDFFRQCLYLLLKVLDVGLVCVSCVRKAILLAESPSSFHMGQAAFRSAGVRMALISAKRV